ncbi:MAG: hypothetical protein PHS44_05140 [Candidatus Dojkabacteria bacterium]|nr:hypothetical protein [Candidatus Dojkabacteria bacterium]
MSEQKKVDFWKEVKNSLKGDNKMFPWLRSGYVLVGIAIGVLVTAFVNIAIFKSSGADIEITETITDEEKCREEGGRYNRDQKTCLTSANDSGESCSDNSDCEGWCLADSNSKVGDIATGTCSEGFDATGCFKFIDNGKVNSICIP